MYGNLQNVFLNRAARLSVIALITLTFASQTHAATANLDDLILGDTLDLGTVTISNFTEISSSSTGLAFPVNTSNVVVNADLVDDTIRLNFLPFIASATQGGTVDYDFSFVINSNMGITEAQLVQIGGGPEAAAFVTIDESISYGGDNGMSLMTSDETVFATTGLPKPTSITVRKNVKVRSSATSSAQISGLRQTYVLVPEMNSMGLAMFALIGGLGLTRKGRRNRK